MRTQFDNAKVRESYERRRRGFRAAAQHASAYIWEAIRHSNELGDRLDDNLRERAGLPPRSPVDAEPEELAFRHAVFPNFRRFQIRGTPSTLNMLERSVDATVTTEAEIPMPDFVRMEMVPEVLLAAGAEWPESRSVPLLRNHRRDGVDDVIGSARNLRVEGATTAATLQFSSVEQSAWTKIVEGHSTDVSAGYQVLARMFIPPGKSQSVGGRHFSGPVNVVTRWRLREVSVVPIGADEWAKMRSA